MISKAELLEGGRGSYLCFLENTRVFVRVSVERDAHGDEVYAEQSCHNTDWRETALLMIGSWELATRPVLYAVDQDRDVAWNNLQKHVKYTGLCNEWYSDKRSAWYVTCVLPKGTC